MSYTKAIVVPLALLGLGIGVMVGGNIYANNWFEEQKRIHKDKERRME